MSNPKTDLERRYREAAEQAAFNLLSKWTADGTQSVHEVFAPLLAEHVKALSALEQAEERGRLAVAVAETAAAAKSAYDDYQLAEGTDGEEAASTGIAEAVMAGAEALAAYRANRDAATGKAEEAQ